MKEAAKQEDHGPPGTDCRIKAADGSEHIENIVKMRITDVLFCGLFRRL